MGARSGRASNGRMTVTVELHDGPDERPARGEGFAWVRWRGVEYEFGDRRQRQVVALLWKAGYDDDHPWVEFAELVIAAEIDQPTPLGVVKLFEGHPAWGTLIESGLLYGGPVNSLRLACL